MPVSLPEIDPKRELARKLVESLLSKIPFIGGPYVAMLSVTHRSDAEKKLAAWRGEITASINNLERAIADLVPTIKLSDDAATLGLWISKHSEQGRSDPVIFDELEDAFPDATKVELEDACGELELEGLATLSGALGHKIRVVRPSTLLFEIFDPIAFEDSNPKLDAARLSRFILEDESRAKAAIIMEHFGWPLRRFNPAMGIVCSMVAPGRRSSELDPTYMCRYLMLDPSERAKLKRYANGVLGGSD